MNSRSHTILDAIDTINLSNKNELKIHCVGADELEAASLDYILDHFHQLFNGLVERDVKRLDFIFNGPNLPLNINNLYYNFVHSLSLNITIRVSTLLYHNYVDNKKNIHQNWQCPDLIVMFNAGLWGYDDWIPTLNLFNMKCMHNVYVLVTSYTLEESEDDQDTIDNICKNISNGTHKSIKWVWEPKVNNYRSLTPEHRETKPSGDKDYYENFATMCFQCYISDIHRNIDDNISSTVTSNDRYDEHFNVKEIEGDSENDKYETMEGVLGKFLNKVAIENAFHESCRTNSHNLLSLYECKYALVRLVGFEVSRKVLCCWLQQWDIEVLCGPFIDLFTFNRILKMVVEKYCDWDWAERTLFERIKAATSDGNRNDNNNVHNSQ